MNFLSDIPSDLNLVSHLGRWTANREPCVTPRKMNFLSFLNGTRDSPRRDSEGVHSPLKYHLKTMRHPLKCMQLDSFQNFCFPEFKQKHFAHSRRAKYCNAFDFVKLKSCKIRRSAACERIFSTLNEFQQAIKCIASWHYATTVIQVFIDGSRREGRRVNQSILRNR